jgi:serine/threonine protein kinase
MSPELFSGQKYDFTSDIYSLGAILFCILTRYKKMVDFKLSGNMKILETTLNETNLKFKENYISIIRKCVQTDPRDRPNAADLFEEFKEIQHELSKMKDEDLIKDDEKTSSSLDTDNPFDSSLKQSINSEYQPEDEMMTPDRSSGGGYSFDESKNSPSTEKESSNSMEFEPPNNISSWLKSIGMSQYESNFIDNGYDDLEIIKIDGLTEEELISIGITLGGHRKKLKVKVNELQKN